MKKSIDVPVAEGRKPYEKVSGEEKLNIDVKNVVNGFKSIEDKV